MDVDCGDEDGGFHTHCESGWPRSWSIYPLISLSSTNIVVVVVEVKVSSAVDVDANIVDVVVEVVVGSTVDVDADDTPSQVEHTLRVLAGVLQSQ